MTKNQEIAFNLLMITLSVIVAITFLIIHSMGVQIDQLREFSMGVMMTKHDCWIPSFLHLYSNH